MRNRGTPANLEHDAAVRELEAERDRYKAALEKIAAGKYLGKPATASVLVTWAIKALA